MYDPRPAKVQLLFALAVLLPICGCSDPNHASVPVSIEQKTPFTYHGQIGRIWGGDNFEIVCNKKIHYAFIRGIDTPEPGQPFYHEAINKLAELCRNKRATIHVVDRDEMKREVCDLTVMDPESRIQTNPALELVRSGLAWHDMNEEVWSQPYKQAEIKAREEKKGIWSQAHPVAPWEYWETQVGNLSDSAGEKK